MCILYLLDILKSLYSLTIGHTEESLYSSTIGHFGEIVFFYYWTYWREFVFYNCWTFWRDCILQHFRHIEELIHLRLDILENFQILIRHVEVFRFFFFFLHLRTD